MLGINQERMAQVVQEAFDKATGSLRWQTAIVKAKQQLEENPYIHFDGNSLLILSPEGEIYTANGKRGVALLKGSSIKGKEQDSSCQCKAYLSGQPCWHRAAARLIQRYNETEH